jgi:hypothetical protein
MVGSRCVTMVSIIVNDWHITGRLTVILIPRQEAATIKPIKTSYSPTAGTAYVTFDNVRVPVKNNSAPRVAGSSLS